ncbi:hypothetical protein C0J52_25899 [Blattella germanica]|nr:hypothetical protein C0J52_25899 [Blattella germanica]
MYNKSCYINFIVFIVPNLVIYRYTVQFFLFLFTGVWTNPKLWNMCCHLARKHQGLGLRTEDGCMQRGVVGWRKSHTSIK